MLDSSLIVAALGAGGRAGQGRPWATPQSRSGRRGSAASNASSAALNPDKVFKDEAIKTEQVLTETTPRK